MKAAFLDRDGTIVVERGYITVPDLIELIPGSAEAIVRLREADWKVFVVTNQGCVAHGMISEDELTVINFRMVTLLSEAGAAVDGIYVCPHHPEGKVPQYSIECDCRKPLPGLLERAASEHGIELEQSIIIGDSIRDVKAGQAAGATSVLVRTGKGTRFEKEEHGAHHVADDLRAAVDWLLSRP